MRVGFELEVDVDAKKLQKQFEKLADDKCMLEIHTIFAKMCDPYVPAYTGLLSQNGQEGQYLNITKNGVRWFAKSDPSDKTSYAHYQYIGQVYGPSIPIFENGILTGFFSPPKQKKHPTGQEIQYSKEYHAKATKEWDKAMMSEQGEEFIEAVKKILLQRCKELYG